MTARAGMAAGQHYAGQLGAPPFITDRRIQCSPDTADLFFPAGKEPPSARQVREAAAKAICAPCPRRRACALWALRTRAAHGVLGGLTETERSAILRRVNLNEHLGVAA